MTAEQQDIGLNYTQQFCTIPQYFLILILHSTTTGFLIPLPKPHCRPLLLFFHPKWYTTTATLSNHSCKQLWSFVLPQTWETFKYTIQRKVLDHNGHNFRTHKLDIANTSCGNSHRKIGTHWCQQRKYSIQCQIITSIMSNSFHRMQKRHHVEFKVTMWNNTPCRYDRDHVKAFHPLN